MNNQFSFEFNNFLKSIQAKPIRIYLQILISFGLLVFGEYSFYTGLDKMSVIGCSLPNQVNNSSSPIIIDNCFYQNSFELTTCMNEIYNTGSNYTLSFAVSTFGISSDKWSSPYIAMAFITFFALQITFQTCHYFQFQKRKRIQDILGESLVYIDGKKKHEKKLALSFLILGIFYILVKIGWILYRTNRYDYIDCNGNSYKLLFAVTLSTSLGTLIPGCIAYLIFPLVYIGGYMDYLGDLGLGKLTEHLSPEAIKQIKHLKILDVDKYNKLITSTITKKYSNHSKLNLFFRTNTFSFFTTPTSEIVEIINNHKQTTPQDFEPMLKLLESKIIYLNDEKEKLIN